MESILHCTLLTNINICDSDICMGSRNAYEKQENLRRTSASLTMLKPLTVWIATIGKNFKEMEIPDYLTCLPRNLYASQKATVRTGHRTDWFKIEKGVCSGCILSPCLFNLYAEYIMRNAGLDEAQAGIKIAGRNINNLKYTDDTTLMAESEEELKSLLMKVKEESEKTGLKLNIHKIKIMASGPITSWQIDGETMETVKTLFSWAAKSLQMVTAAMKLRWLLLRRKAMTNPDSILKSKDITFLTKVHLVKAMVFPVLMYGCEIWTIKKAEW